MTPDEKTYKIIGCAMKVHKTLGNGFQEVIYQRCLAIEFRKAGLEFVRILENIGFANVKWQPLTFGSCAFYIMEK